MLQRHGCLLLENLFSVPYGSFPPIFPSQLSGLLGMERVWENAHTSLPACLMPESKRRNDRVFLLLLPSYTEEESGFAPAYALYWGRKGVEMVRVSSFLLLTLMKSDTRDPQATEIIVHPIVRVHNQFFLSCFPSPSGLCSSLLWLTQASKL